MVSAVTHTCHIKNSIKQDEWGDTMLIKTEMNVQFCSYPICYLLSNEKNKNESNLVLD